MIHVTAPGKLFVTGEWAVLRGAPALVAAVDRVVRLEVDAVPGDGTLAIESLAEGRAWQGDGRAADAPQGDAGAVVAVLRHLGWLAGRIVVDSRPFLIGERKLGLGRSAATIAATVFARRALARAAVEPESLLSDALAANARFQEGQGSGADVAAALFGGVVAAERRDDRLAVCRHALPAGLELIAGWTGESAATTPLITAFASMPSPPVLTELIATARDAVAAIAAGDATRLCGAVDRSGELLERFGDETGLPIVTPALARLVAVARKAGAVAKPSGAGGGDCGIAIAPTARIAAAVRTAWRDAGILPVDVTVAATGAARG